MFDMTEHERFIFDLFKDDGNCIWNDEKNYFYIPNGTETGYIRFYGDKMMELEVYEGNKKIPSFYLQFALVSKTSARGYFQSFFNYLLKKGDQNRHVEHVEFKNANKILFTCTCGASSSYFATQMQEKVDPEKKDIIFDACANTLLDEVQQGYDLIVLMPQINYKQKEYIEKYGDKVISANTQDVATRNLDNILHQILTVTS